MARAFQLCNGATLRAMLCALLVVACTEPIPPIVEETEETLRVLKAAGEHPSENELQVPEGAAFRAVNVVVDRPDMYSAHRGLEASDAAGHALTALTYYKGDLIAHSQPDGVLLRLHAGVWTTYSGTYYAASSDGVVSFDEAEGSLFFATEDGVFRLDGVDGTPRLSGLPQALPGVVGSLTSGSALSDGFATAYRANWAINADDSGNGRLIEGAPSPRFVVANTSGGTVDVPLTFPIPDNLPAGAYVRLFRADEVPVDISPLDEMRQVYEREPSPAELADGKMTITDSTPDTVKGSASYWSANTGDGLAQSNYSAPLVRRLTHFAESEFGAGVSGVHRLVITLLGAGGISNGNGLRFRRGSTIETYTAGSTEMFPNQFALVTGGSPSQNTVATVDSLVRAINSRVGGFLRAFALDTDSTSPGAFLVEARDLDQTPITVEATGDPQAWSPAPISRVSASATRPIASSIVTVNTTIPHGLLVGQPITIVASSAPSVIHLGTFIITFVTSTTFTFTDPGVDGGAGIEFVTGDELVHTTTGTVDNAYAWTKRFEPDHWPLANLDTVGGATDTLWWALPFDRWLFLGSDAGLYRINGNADDGFQSPEEGAPWESSTAFLGRRNVAALDGQGYALSKRGIVTWGEGSKPMNIDGPIQQEIREAIANYPDALAEYGFFFADATNHRLYVAMPESGAWPPRATIIRVWNALTGTWTRLTSAFAGLEAGVRDGIAPVASAGVVHLLPSSSADSDREGTVLSTRNTATADDFQGPEGQGLQCKVTYMPWTAGDPMRFKMWTRSAVYTKRGLSRLTFGYATDLLPTEETQTYPDIDPDMTQPVEVSDPIQGLAWRNVLGNTPGNSYLRGRKLSVSVAHSEPAEEFQLYGVEVKHRVYGEGQ